MDGAFQQYCQHQQVTSAGVDFDEREMQTRENAELMVVTILKKCSVVLFFFLYLLEQTVRSLK